MPTKTRDFQVLLYIEVILIDKKMVMNLTNQDLHQICNVTSILRFNDVTSFFLLNCNCCCVGNPQLIHSVKIYINELMNLTLSDPVIFRLFNHTDDNKMRFFLT